MMPEQYQHAYTYFKMREKYDPGQIGFNPDAVTIFNEYGYTTYDLIYELGKKVHDTCVAILDEAVPVGENIQFIFYIENMSVALREQMVRHRIGSNVGERMGVDFIPDLAQSTWWSQTTRVLPLDTFYDEGRFLVPESLDGKTVFEDEEGDPKTGAKRPDYTANDMYMEFMEQCQFVYNKLVEAGVPREDARLVIPMAMSHGITWGINLKALIHIFGKRGCWIAQAGLWDSMIQQMVTLICQHVDPMFRKLALPPCLKKGSYSTCPIKMINMERVQGRDGMPPCPLFVYHQTKDAAEAYTSVENPAWKLPINDLVDPSGEQPDGLHTLAGWAENRDLTKWIPPNDMEAEMLRKNSEVFGNLWQLNVMTGEPV